MKSKTIAIIMILLASIMVCSCNMDPEISGDAEKTLRVGMGAVEYIMNKYQTDGSYPGLNIVAGDNYVMVLNFSNCSATLDLSAIDPSLGTKTVVVNGQVSYKFEAYPESYPSTMTFNISFSYGGSFHTLEMKVRATGVSSMSATNIKVDGKKYRDESI